MHKVNKYNTYPNFLALSPSQKWVDGIEGLSYAIFSLVLVIISLDPLPELLLFYNLFFEIR